MLTRFRPKTTLLVVALLAAFLYAWLQLGPSVLGGRVTYMVVKGQSMEPVFTAGDLVLARPAKDYDVGDIIAYHSALLDVTVMHRIIERGTGTFTTQGDNNNWIDEYKPTREDVLGSPWVKIPKAGTYLLWASRPINASLLLCVGSLISFGGLFAVRKRRHRRGPDGARRRIEPTGPLSELRAFLRSQRAFFSSLQSPPGEEESTVPESTRAPPRNSDHKNPFEMLLVGLIAGLIPVLLLGAFALTQPSTRSETGHSLYQQSSEFNYAAYRKADPVYIDPPVITGEPIFRRLVSSFDVYFDYEFSAVAPHFMSGTGQLVMELSDEESGWKRGFILGPISEFDGNKLRLAGSIDLAQLGQLIEDFKTLTGIQRETYLLSIRADMDVGGTVAGQACCDPGQSSPTVYFLIDQLQILPSADGQSIIRSPEQFTVTEPGELDYERVLPNSLGFLGFSTTVSKARNFGWAAAVLISPCVALFAISARRNPILDESVRIKGNYGPLLIDVEHSASTVQGTHFQTTSMRNLVRMAEKLDLAILHSQSGDLHTYFIHDGSAIYSYETEDRRWISDAGDDDAQAAAA